MKRTGFARPVLERAPRTFPKPEPQRFRLPALLDPRASVQPIQKAGAVQHEAYMAAVRRLPCAHCGRAPPSQFCHADQDKGGMLKTDCRLGWPGCGPRLGEPGCHHLIGSTGSLGKEERRALEVKYGACTRQSIIASGEWPESLLRWPLDQSSDA